MKKLSSLLLLTILLIGFVSCVGGDGGLNSQDTTNIGDVFESQSNENDETLQETTVETEQQETTSMEALFRDLLGSALTDSALAEPFYWYHPSSIYYGLPGQSRRLKEIVSGVYMDPTDWEAVVNNVPGDTLFLFEVYIAPVIESYYFGIEPVTGGSHSNTIHLYPQLSEEEFYEAFEMYRPVLDANEIIYYLDSDGNPGTHIGYGDEYFQCFSCLMTPEQILNFQMPEGQYIVIGFFMCWK